MTHDQRYVFRQVLSEMLDQMTFKRHVTTQAISQSFHSCSDYNDRASLESDRSLLILLGEHQGGLIQQIRTALGRLDDGSYGICEDCGDEIPIRRLQVQPMSTLCVSCKEYKEKAASPRPLSWA
jgi:DnaK suppressor protein